MAGTVAPDTIETAVLKSAVAVLTATTGLTFPGGRRMTLERALRAVTLEAALPGVEVLVDQLDRDESLLARVVNLVRIGETYFFRHPEQLEVVSRRILPGLVAAAASAGGRRTVDIWSAGCSTGEEAYSLAILAAERVTGPTDPQVRVAATDIDAEALSVAAAATYGRWSFRSDLGERTWWFESDGRLRRVRREIIERVTFGLDNLAGDDLGSPAGASGPFGLIVCRNVTMYLSPDARRRAAARFHQLLAPGGWLIVAPVELSHQVYAGFEVVTLDGLTFYRRAPHDGPGRRPPPRRAELGPLGLSSSDSQHTAERPALRSTSHPRPARPAPRPARPPAPDHLTVARSLADLGRLPEARRAVDLAVREQPLDRQAHLLLALVAEAEDDLAGAAGALRRAVYLDRSDANAQFRLGLVEWRLGRIAQARARLATAVRLVDGHDDDRVLDGAPDLTVARLRSTAKMLGNG